MRTATLACALFCLLVLPACDDGGSPTEPIPPTPTPRPSELAWVAGTVTRHGAALAGATVSMVQGVTRRDATTGASGAFALSALATGHWQATVLVGGTPLLVQQAELAAGLNLLDLRIGQHRLVPYGTVRDARTRQPIAGATVALRWYKETMTDERGDWRLDFGPGEPQSGGTIQ